MGILQRAMRAHPSAMDGRGAGERPAYCAWVRSVFAAATMLVSAGITSAH